MPRRLPDPLLECLLIAAILPPASCAHSPPGPGPALPKVTVTLAIEREILDSIGFQDHTEAVEAVEVWSRTTGYLDKVNCSPDTEIKAVVMTHERVKA
jgi:hypothetical protein